MATASGAKVARCARCRNTTTNILTGIDVKLQIEGQRLRFRVDEAELAQLLAGESVVDQTQLGEAQILLRRIVLCQIAAAQLDWGPQEIRLDIPEDAVRAYAQSLPRRDALSFTLEAGANTPAPVIDFEVDVRDSVRHRMPRAKS